MASRPPWPRRARGRGEARLACRDVRVLACEQAPVIHTTWRSGVSFAHTSAQPRGEAGGARAVTHSGPSTPARRQEMLTVVLFLSSRVFFPLVLFLALGKLLIL